MRALRSTWGARLMAAVLAAGLLVPLLSPVGVQAEGATGPDRAAQVGAAGGPLLGFAAMARPSHQRLSAGTASLHDLRQRVSGALPAGGTLHATAAVGEGERHVPERPRVISSHARFVAQPRAP